MEKITLKQIENNSDYSYTSIFRSIACVGDSLSSGEFELVDGENRSYYDKFEYSWGQFIGRKNGSKIYNFSRGGMTAKEYCDSFGEANNFWDKEKRAQAYIIALGHNDLFGLRQEVGKISDINDDYTKNNTNFITYYSQIIQRYKEINKDAKIFLTTMPKSTLGEDFEKLKEEHRKVLYELTKVFSNTYVLDLYEYSPEHDREYQEKYYLNGHLNPVGYLIAASTMDKIIHNIIKENLKDFELVGMN